jgi:intracellular sulfur oxidation DsrE/DsrF family protein
VAGTGVTRRAAIGAGAAGATAGLGAVGGGRARGEATPARDAALPADFGVVLHVSDADHWPSALSNLENLSAAQPAARIRVVVDGVGVYALQGETDVVKRLAPLVEAGVRLEVCPNALREHGIPEGAAPDFADTSLGGVVALVVAQRVGFAYVKP